MWDRSIGCRRWMRLIDLRIYKCGCYVYRNAPKGHERVLCVVASSVSGGFFVKWIREEPRDEVKDKIGEGVVYVKHCVCARVRVRGEWARVCETEVRADRYVDDSRDDSLGIVRTIDLPVLDYPVQYQTSWIRALATARARESPLKARIDRVTCVHETWTGKFHEGGETSPRPMTIRRKDVRKWFLTNRTYFPTYIAIKRRVILEKFSFSREIVWFTLSLYVKETTFIKFRSSLQVLVSSGWHSRFSD